MKACLLQPPVVLEPVSKSWPGLFVPLRVHAGSLNRNVRCRDREIKSFHSCHSYLQSKIPRFLY